MASEPKPACCCDAWDAGPSATSAPRASLSESRTFALSGPRTAGPRPVRATVRAIAAVIAFVLVPKCPACLAVYLGMVGVGAGVALPLATGLRVAVIALTIALAASALLAAWAVVRRALRHARASRAL